MQFPGSRVQFSQSNLGSILNLGIIFPLPSIPDIIGRNGCDEYILPKSVWISMTARSGDED